MNLLIMKELLQEFEQKQPEIVFEWKDTETDAEGWVVINSLRGELPVVVRGCVQVWTVMK
ncbi:hypothetical protein [Sphingobacterium daejeonense]|uniref:hypothetical protein n=1 Tax=Sphingobacterium daejeonense TaxID=371142 RepID=UPI0010C4B908|nr:hypothetical protein [Sphingobacterium daejeonense]VTQ02180.1 Uncharacterised protein [Sphingobacterium daejeonense]